MTNYSETMNARANIIMLMLREDHRKLSRLFDQFDNTTDKNEKQNIVASAITALEVHATLEEELIYPAWKESMDEQHLIDAAIEEYHLVQVLIKELKNMGPEDKEYDAKFTTLSQHVMHHIKEEEGNMFPRAEKVYMEWEGMTEQVLQRRRYLERKELWLCGAPVIFKSRGTTSATRSASRLKESLQHR